MTKNKNPETVYSPQSETPYNGWLVSNNFLKRAFGVWGHMFVANLIIIIPFMIIWVIIKFIIIGGVINNFDISQFQEY